MAVVTPTQYDSAGPDASKMAQGVVVIEWGPLTTTDDEGAPVYMPDYPDKTIHFTGDFGSSPATIVLEGSGRPGTTQPKAPPADADFSTLNDPLSEPISKAAQAIEAVLENPCWYRPRIVSGGDGGTAIYATLVCTKTARR